MKSIVSRAGFALAALCALIFAAVALGAPATINNVTLEAAGGDAEFDPDDDEDGCLDNSEMYSPISDGSAYGKSDAFDGALMMLFDGLPFRSGPEGNHVGQQLTVGPRKLAGVRVTRIDRGLPNTPTLRSLIRLKNTTNRHVSRSATFHSDLGSDSDTMIEASSSGDKRLSRADRWVLTSDEEPLSDPPVTHVLRGKGKTPRGRLVEAFGAYRHDGDGSECVFATFNVKLRPKQTGYLLLYVDLSETVQSGKNGTKKYNRKRLNKALKAGLPAKVQRNVLNWDLTG